MVFGEVLQRFVNERPISVMVRMLLENQLGAKRLNAIFAETAQKQYTKELAFSTCVQLLGQVTLGTTASLHAAYKQERDSIPVSVVALYGKLQHVEPPVCEALVGQTSQGLLEVIDYLESERTEPVAGYRLRVLDGNMLAGTEHRLKELRCSGAAALPGQSLVLYAYRTGLIDGLVTCEDAHTNERKLLPRLLPLVAAGDLILADRNFCTQDFLEGLVQRRAAFLIRHHGGMRLEPLDRRRKIGRCSTGTVFEQSVRLSSGLVCRAIIIERNKPLQHGGRRVILLTNVSRKIKARQLAELYWRRWTIEEAFRQLTDYLACEVRTLGYPQAALLGFTLAVLAYNCVACVRSALASVHGRAKVTRELSSYYLAWEIKSSYEGMIVAVPRAEWEAFANLDAKGLARVLHRLAQQVDWPRYTKSPRGPKKPVRRQKVRRGAHVATARILEKRQTSTRKRSQPKSSKRRLKSVA